MSIILFIILYFILRFFFSDINTVILISLGAAIWLCCIRIFLKVDNIESKVNNAEKNYDKIMNYISKSTDETLLNNFSDNTDELKAENKSDE